MEQKTHKDYEAKVAERKRASSEVFAYVPVIDRQVTTIEQPEGQWND